MVDEKGDSLATEKSGKLGVYLRDGAILIGVVYALAYHFGQVEIQSLWNFLGLKRPLFPEIGVETIVVNGGMTVFVGSSIALITYNFWKTWRGVTERSSIGFLARMGIVLAVVVSFHVLAIWEGWVLSKGFKGKSSRVVSLEMKEGGQSPVTAGGILLGSKEGFFIFLQGESANTEEFVLVAKDEIRCVKMR